MLDLQATATIREVFIGIGTWTRPLCFTLAVIFGKLLATASLLRLAWTDRTLFDESRFVNRLVNRYGDGNFVELKPTKLKLLCYR